VTCHDLLAVRSALGEIPQNPTRWSGRILQKLVLRGLATARVIACDSEATHRDVLRLVNGAGGRSSVLQIGLNARFHPVPGDEARRRVLALMGERGKSTPGFARFVLHVGDDSWYKNRQGVVEIFSQLHRSSEQPDLWLVMVGKPLDAGLKKRIQEAGIRDRVLELSGVPHEDLCAIYSAAEMLLFPSLQEGFGWPVIEAQACGCRVVTTNRPPMNDVGGDAAAYLDPEDISASLDVVLNVLYEDGGQRQARVGRGLANAAKHSTGAMLAGYLALYERVVGDGIRADLGGLPLMKTP
jgi:glycosyltransferase involved in cell wall biosynthesis